MGLKVLPAPGETFSGTAAGGVLGGTYPDPTFAADMATQAELDSEANTRSTADGLRVLKSTIPFELIVAISDETTAITTGNGKITFRAPFAMTLTKIKASLSTAGTTSSAFDVNDGGVSVFSTTLTIDANEKTSESAATPAVISDTAIADDAEITIDIDTAGTGAKGAKLTFIGTRAQA